MIKVNEFGAIRVNKEVMLKKQDMKALIKLIVAGEGEFNGGEWIHSRWSALYNTYDMVCGTDIRAEHKNYYIKVSRLQYMASTGQLGKLLEIASKVYKAEFEEYVKRYV